MPGAGKTTTMHTVAEKLGIEVVSTDKLFRIFRADSNHPVTKEFVAKMAQKGIKIDTSKLADGKIFRTAYGEDVFRDYEDLMIQYLDKFGALKDKIMDLSSSFYLRENNRKYLKDNEYKTILLNPDEKIILSRLINDFYTYQKNGKTIRGNYERAGLNAISEGRKAEDGIKELATKDRNFRVPQFRHADIFVAPKKSDGVDMVSDMIIKELNNQR